MKTILERPRFIPGIKGRDEYRAWRNLNKIMELNMIILSRLYYNDYRYWIDEEYTEFGRMFPFSLISYFRGIESVSLDDAYEIIHKYLMMQALRYNINIEITAMDFCYEKGVKELNRKTGNKYCDNVPVKCPWDLNQILLSMNSLTEMVSNIKS